MSRSRRPTGTTRTSPPTRSTTVGRPFGSRAVVIVPRGLLSRTWRSACLPTSRPSTRTTFDAADERVELARRAVDRHPAGLDQLVGAAPRRDAGPREIGVQAHARHSRGVRLRPCTDHADLTRRLADLIVGYGANVQPGQIVAVTTYPGKEELTREVARAAYEHGARWVDVVVFDPRVKRERLAARRRVDARLRAAVADRPARVALRRACGTRDAERAGRPRRARGRRSRPCGTRRAPVPPEHRRRRQPRDHELVRRRRARRPAGRRSSTRNSTPGAAYDRLWEAIAHICRLDEPDPAAAWRERARTLDERRRPTSRSAASTRSGSTAPAPT